MNVKSNEILEYKLALERDIIEDYNPEKMKIFVTFKLSEGIYKATYKCGKVKAFSMGTTREDALNNLKNQLRGGI